MATVTIQKRQREKGTTYVVNFKNPATGKNTYYRTYKRQKEAQQAANELRTLLDTGKMPEVEKSKKRLYALTFKETGEMLVAKWEAQQTPKKLAATTLDGYLLRLRQANNHFGSRLLCQIQAKDVADYRDMLTNSISAITANRIMFVVKQVFKLGLSLGAIAVDPSASLAFSNEDSYRRNKFLFPNEIRRLVEASQQVRSKHYLPALIYLGVEHGASKQEALSLKWADIRFDAGQSGTIRFYRTKNGHERTEQLMPKTRQALLEWRGHLEKTRQSRDIAIVENQYVFCRLDGTNIQRFDKTWRTVCKDGGFKDLHFHDLRHTFCSNARMIGADLADIKDMIGHSDISMTHRYAHLASPRKLALQDALAKHYSETWDAAVGG